ncbi:glycosyltransferase family 2 protein [Dermabacteraceae bacterium P7074]
MYEASVVIPAFNAERHLALQLESLSKQSASFPFEVIVVDNNSTDDTAAVARGWSKKISGLKVVSANEKKGAAYARNLGAACALSEKLLFCDSDDVVAENWVAEGALALDAFDVFSGAVVSIENAIFSDGVATVWSVLKLVSSGECGGLPATRSEDGASGDRPPSFLSAVSDEAEDGVWPVMYGGNCGFKREFYLENGGFSESVNPLIEDNDFCQRLRARGTLIKQAGSSVIAYRRRDPSFGLAKLEFKRAYAASELCRAYDLWGCCAIYKRGWQLSLFRAVGAGLLMVTGLKKRDWANLAGRIGNASGAAWGYLRNKPLV